MSGSGQPAAGRGVAELSHSDRKSAAARECTASGAVVDDPILQKVRAALDELYGDRIERVVLFGSRARGEAHEDSDCDIAVFLRDLTDRWHEFHRLADLRTDVLIETGAFVEAKPFRAGAYDERTPLMYEIRGEGVDF